MANTWMHRLGLLLLLVFALAACNRDVDIQPNGDGTVTVTVSITEAEINTLINSALAESANPLLRNPSVDLQNGQIVVTGEHDRRDGGGRVNGSITIQAGTSNDTITIQVTSVAIEGVDLSDARIAEINQRLAERLGARARRDNDRATLESVTVTDSALEIQIRVQTPARN